MPLRDLLFISSRLITLVSFAFFIFFLYTFLREGEKRAALVSVIVSAVLLAAFLLLSVVALPLMVPAIGSAVFAFFIFALFLPIGKKEELARTGELIRYDERDIMFARIRYAPGSDAYEDYYSRNPGKKSFDDALRQMPQLGEPGSEYYDGFDSALADATFDLLEKWRPLAESGAMRPRRMFPSPDFLTRHLKGLAKYYGAAESGVAALRDYHMYSHIGRGSGKYGAPISVSHSFVFVFAVSMNYRMIRNAPGNAVTIESSRYYVDAARIGLVIAEYLRYLGFEARTHMDGNYRLILPAVAVDAGLGELGRLNLLITENRFKIRSKTLS